MVNVRSLLETKKGASKLTIATTDTVLDALKVMADAKIGAVLVTENEKIVGIFTERDYLKKGELAGKTAKTTPVKDLMTKDMYTVKMNTSVEQCMALMDEHHFRHLPVVEGDQMFGILSIRDVLTAVLKNKVSEMMGLENYFTATGFAG
ncbi:MAG: CBS domain-containing protein [Spirochaetia bacterium]|jgi:CBS domain-containing protein|nr:CBS domain-containing protein [Spirochaetia bacterium]